jgi:hypothetical protein
VFPVDETVKEKKGFREIKISALLNERVGMARCAVRAGLRRNKKTLTPASKGCVA